MLNLLTNLPANALAVMFTPPTLIMMMLFSFAGTTKVQEYIKKCATG